MKIGILVKSCVMKLNNSGIELHIRVNSLLLQPRVGRMLTKVLTVTCPYSKLLGMPSQSAKVLAD